MELSKVSKAIAGAVAGAVTGNAGMLAMTTAQIDAMPWWGVIVANVIYAGIGFATVYFAPKNAA